LPFCAETQSRSGTRVPYASLVGEAGENFVSGADLSGGSAWTLRLSNLYLSGMHTHHVHVEGWPRNRKKNGGIFLGVRSGIRSPALSVFCHPGNSLEKQHRHAYMRQPVSQPQICRKIAYSGTPVNSSCILKFLLALL
jgi:hypothetical protein